MTAFEEPLHLRVNLASSSKWDRPKAPQCVHCGMVCRKGFLQTADETNYLGIWICDCSPHFEDIGIVRPILTRGVDDPRLGDPKERWRNIRLNKFARRRFVALADQEAERVRDQNLSPKERHASFVTVTILRLIVESKL